MSNNTLRVVARLYAKPGKENELRSLLIGLIEPTHKEQGCRSYEMLENIEDPAEFTFVEEWTDESRLLTHFETDHIQNALSKFPDLLASELDVRKYHKVA
ncbi:antibiotic biosynthesis monooxygenase [Desulfobacterota bacterium AH_259_B03_O07]|nr:antibiotic biosynthesis monooxygenase [Desulfobacterota bacterium AH_259_B03_O07]